MGRFNEYAKIQRLHGEDFLLLNDLVYTTTDGATYTVRLGFISDLGSIPRLLWSLLPKSEFPSAYILHDYLCGKSFISWADNSNILREAIIASNGGRFKAWVIFVGVAGWGPVKKLIRVLVQKLN